MTLDRRETINIPKWLVIVAIPILLGGVGGYATSRYSAGKQEKQIEVNTKRLDVVESNKVNYKEFELVLEGIDRIEQNQTRLEGKLDDHIDKH